MTPRLTSAALLTAAGLLAPAAPAHAVDWLTPFTIADPSAIAPAVALDGAGDAFVAWQDELHRVFVKVRPAGGSFGNAANLSAGAQEAPVVATNARGQVVVAWFEQDGLDPARLAYALGGPGGFGPVQQVPDPGDFVTDLSAAVDGSGTVVLAWAAETDVATQVRAAHVPAGGAPIVATLSGNDGDGLSPAAAANAAGAAVVAWSKLVDDDDGVSTRFQLQVARRASPGTQFTSVQDVGPALTTVEEPVGDQGTNTSGEEHGAIRAALDDVGGALIAVERLVNDPGSPQDGDDDDQSSVIDAALGSVAGGLGPASQVSPAGETGSEPVLAVNGAGHAVLAWTADASKQLRAASRPPGSTFGDVETLAAVPPGQSIADASAAVRAGGDAVVAWVAGGPDGSGPVHAATRPPGGDFAARTISAPDAPALAPDVGADGEGNALAVWQLGPVLGSAQGAAFDGAGPRVTALSVPGSGVVGQELRFGVAGADTWSPFTVRWDFGDGAVADGLNLGHTFTSAGRYTVTAILTDATGNASASAPRTVVIGPAGGPPPPPDPEPAPATAAAVPGAAKDATRPSVSKVALLRTVFRVGDRPGPFVAAGSARAAGLPRGSQLRFTLSEQSRVQITVSRMATVPGKVSRCVRLGAPPRAKRPSIGRVGTVAVSLPAGTRTIPFSGRIGRTALARGRYAIRLQAVDAAGNVSKVKEVRVTIC